jgi:hypothetical protein
MKELSIDEMTSIRGGLQLEMGTVKIIGLESGNVRATTNVSGPTNIGYFNGDCPLIFLIEGSNDQIIL